MEYAREKNGPSVGRHQIAHVDLLDPADAARFRELEVTANIQPLWARRDPEVVEHKLPLIGEERAAHHFPFGTLVQAGARLAAGSDWPVTSADPLMGGYTAVTRTAPPRDIHGDEESRTVPLEPQERITLEQALAAYTSGAAHSLHLDHLVGRIAPDMLADLVVLDRDIRDVDALARAQVERVYVGGELVHQC
ncbi:amidohydrolase family protein [Streptomyces arenae]|nr:amidohydrolase family protein [Streptomyces arenae]